MPTLDLFGLRVALEEEKPLPEPDNDNWGTTSEEETPAEVLQWVRQRRKRHSRELIQNPGLWACVEHRLTRTITLAIEKCTRWHHYGER